jgi:hypothetical protein
MNQICNNALQAVNNDNARNPSASSSAAPTGQAAVVLVQDCKDQLATADYNALLAWQQQQAKEATKAGQTGFDPAYMLFFYNSGGYTPYRYVASDPVALGHYRTAVSSRLGAVSSGVAAYQTSHPSTPFSEALGKNTSFQQFRAATQNSPLSGRTGTRTGTGTTGTSSGTSTTPKSNSPLKTNNSGGTATAPHDSAGGGYHGTGTAGKGLAAALKGLVIAVAGAGAAVAKGVSSVLKRKSH